MPQSFDGLVEMAGYDAEVAARAIDYAARFGRSRGLPGAEVARLYYHAFGSDPVEWAQLCTTLVMSARTDKWIEIARRFGQDGLTEVMQAYRAAFVPRLERDLRYLGNDHYDNPPPIEDPGGLIAPWLQLLAELERPSKPSLGRRLLGRLG